MSTLYVESSALLRVALEGDTTLRRHMATHDRLITSSLTWVEADRALRRARTVPRLDRTRLQRAQRWIDSFLASCAELVLESSVLSRARQGFPVEPVRTLDALHLASILTWDQAPLPGNQMAVSVLDSILENTFYEGAYDPENPQPPMCFAFARDEKTMAPHKLVVDAHNQQCGASGLCAGCPQNEWGTAEKGRGTACKNTRRLALIPAGQFNQADKFQLISDEDHYATTPIGFMKLPITRVTGFSSFVKQVAGTIRRPPHGIVTKVRVVPDPKNQFKVLFEPIVNVPDELMAAVMKRHEEAGKVIDFPYQPAEEETKTKKPAAKTKRKY